MSDFPTQIGPNVGGIHGIEEYPVQRHLVLEPVFHRDLKPANIKIATDGVAKAKASPCLGRKFADESFAFIPESDPSGRMSTEFLFEILGRILYGI